jgi:hypothetical protein
VWGPLEEFLVHNTCYSKYSLTFMKNMSKRERASTDLCVFAEQIAWN